MLGRPVVPALLSAVLLCACSATPLSPGYRAELDARVAPAAHLGEQIDLLDKEPARLIGAQASDGRAHVWVIDRERMLHHIEVDPAGGVTRERIGSVGEDFAAMAFDAVESPPGTWRVLAGPNQFVRAQAGSPWREVAGNRCRRLLTIGDKLLCGFVMSGEELGTPTRTDVYGGIFVIIPFAIPVQRQSKKLVLAEAVGESWVIRTVLDPRDVLDADPNFLMGADRDGNVHLVYSVGRGGALLIISAGVAGGSPESAPRYARVEAASLRDPAPIPAPEGIARYEGVNGHPIGKPPWGFWAGPGLAVDPATGLVAGLIYSQPNQPPIAFRGQEIRIDGLVDIEMRQGVWQNIANMVLLGDWPYPHARYLGQRSVAFDTHGRLHALVPHCTSRSMWDPCDGAISYLVKKEGQWSRPITVGGPFSHEGRSLVIPGTRRTLAVWFEHRSGLTGQWVDFGEDAAR